MNFDSITKTEKPSRFKPLAPMWNADGKLLASCQEQDAVPYSKYKQGPIPQFQNGRVIGLDSVKGPGFKLFTNDGNDKDSYKTYILQGTLNRSPLSELFFSSVNIKRVQDLLRYRVWTASGGKYKIGPQSETELVIIMRAILLQHGKFLPYQLGKQVQELDRLVVEFALPKMMAEIKQAIGFYKDISQLPVPIAHPVNLSSAGTRTLKSVTTTF